MTCREEILEVVRELVRDRPDGLFSAREVMGIMRAQRSRYSTSGIETHINCIMCVASPGQRRKKYDDFERVSRGRYRLRERSPVSAE